ncbi:MAG: hypothetical protein J6T74_02285, partial [Clostridia bacterium]|nr:hypothetical protein [Clostridia bacterium]
KRKKESQEAKQESPKRQKNKSQKRKRSKSNFHLPIRGVSVGVSPFFVFRIFALSLKKYGGGGLNTKGIQQREKKILPQFFKENFQPCTKENSPK